MEATSPQNIAIRAEPGSDPTLCRFVCDRELFHGSFVCQSREVAKGSGLLESLLAIDGITQVRVAGSALTVQKLSDEPWPSVGKRIGAALREWIASGERFVPPQAPAASADGLGARIQRVLDEQVNPGVAGHGGRIELVEVRGGAVYLRMSGGCQGCGAAQMTLRQGVEKALRAQIPGITEVIDVTDHGAGKNPFFARSH